MLPGPVPIPLLRRGQSNVRTRIRPRQQDRGGQHSDPSSPIVRSPASESCRGVAARSNKLDARPSGPGPGDGGIDCLSSTDGPTGARVCRWAVRRSGSNWSHALKVLHTAQLDAHLPKCCPLITAPMHRTRA